MQKSPGLSDYLTRHVHSAEIVQAFTAGTSIKFDVISAGKIPPNPMELLSSARMEKLIEKFKGVYDYIILDLPPVEEVSDALVAAKLADGVLMVVRQDYCNRTSIENALKQLEFVNAKILGVIFNATYDDGFGKRYYYKNKYYGNKKYYGYRYGYYRKNPYESSYESSANEAKRAAENRGENAELQKFVRKRSDSANTQSGNENSEV
jgi:capsular exopolysaccharide synthesis family protein